MKKKISKNVLKTLIVTMLILSMLPQFAAIAKTPESTYEYQYTVSGMEKTVLFENDVFTEEERIHVAESLLGLNDEISPCGLLCTLFGHDYGAESEEEVITHKVRAYDPRCKREYYITQVCSRCDYIYFRRISEDYISCCPVD